MLWRVGHGRTSAGLFIYWNGHFGTAALTAVKVEDVIVVAGEFFPLRNEGGPVSVEGVAVRRARWAADLAQAEVSERVRRLGYFLPQPYVSAVERGRYRWGFTERMVTALAAALGVGVSEITGGRLLSKAQVSQVRELTRQVDAAVSPQVAAGGPPKGRAQGHVRSGPPPN